LGISKKCTSYSGKYRKEVDFALFFLIVSTLPQNELEEMILRYGGTPKEVLDEMKDIIIPIIRADWGANENYQFQVETPLPVNLTAMVGDKDNTPDISETTVKGWKLHTSGSFVFKVFSGDHFYLTTTSQDECIQLIASTLSK